MSVHVRAPGKLNIALRVGSAAEDGYHPLATVFQAVSLQEDVVAHLADEVTVTVTGRDADAVPTDERNLAWRAAALLAEATGTDAGVRLEIAKSVPAAGGMGGGSADAAAALLACDLLWGTGLAREELGHIAAELGADVPFALTGHTALGIGRGDVLTPALARGTYHWVLALAQEGLATPSVFSAWDQANPSDVPVPQTDEGLMQALISGSATDLAPYLVNDLQPAAMTLRPELTQVIEVVEHAGAIAAVLSGSGPTVAGLVADAASAQRVADRVRVSGVAADVLTVHGPVPGARVVEQVRDPEALV